MNSEVINQSDFDQIDILIHEAEMEEIRRHQKLYPYLDNDFLDALGREL